MDPALSDSYFQSRPKASQLGAIVSPQSCEIENRSVLDEAYATLEEQYKDMDAVPRPVHWGGYWLVPEAVEFWQGRNGRLHDRLLYVKYCNGWKISRLAP